MPAFALSPTTKHPHIIIPFNSLVSSPFRCCCCCRYFCCCRWMTTEFIYLMVAHVVNSRPSCLNVFVASVCVCRYGVVCRDTYKNESHVTRHISHYYYFIVLSYHKFIANIFLRFFASISISSPNILISGTHSRKYRISKRRKQHRVVHTFQMCLGNRNRCENR